MTDPSCIIRNLPQNSEKRNSDGQSQDRILYGKWISAFLPDAEGDR